MRKRYEITRIRTFELRNVLCIPFLHLRSSLDSFLLRKKESEFDPYISH